jgi:glycosyltransferase involved in cell wall biosynthesis
MNYTGKKIIPKSIFFLNKNQIFQRKIQPFFIDDNPTFQNGPIPIKQLTPKIPKNDEDKEKMKKVSVISKKVSVIIPMYNVEKYINVAIQSLINQSYSDVEIILVDDASKDNTFKIASEWVKRYPNIFLFRNLHNYGTYISINFGITKSTGEFITIMGSDDQFAPSKIKEQVDLLSKYPDVIACYCKYVRRHYQTHRVMVCEIGESTIMFRRDIIAEIGYYDSVRFGADSEYRDRIKKVYGMNRIRNIHKVLYYALYRPHSLTSGGVSHSGSKDRHIYKKNYMMWHKNSKNKLFLSFPLKKRPFKITKNLL